MFAVHQKKKIPSLDVRCLLWQMKCLLNLNTLSLVSSAEFVYMETCSSSSSSSSSSVCWGRAFSPAEHHHLSGGQTRRQKHVDCATSSSCVLSLIYFLVFNCINICITLVSVKYCITFTSAMCLRPWQSLKSFKFNVWISVGTLFFVKSK